MTRIPFTLDGRAVDVSADAGSLLDALRGPLGVRGVKDGCSPQGQCGCCTVWVDGQPRVACVTPVARVRGRSVTTIEGLDDAQRDRWANALSSTGGSQCGFCTPGIIMRLAALDPEKLAVRAEVDRALLAHLCRCTGWQTIVEAAAVAAGGRSSSDMSAAPRSMTDAAERAAIEGRTAQQVGPDVALGRGHFADDTAPPDALIALRGGDGWVVAESMPAARAAAGRVQGRRTTAPLRWPLDLPDPGPEPWARTLTTTWVEPAYLELDASWCEPGGEPASPLANGGAFGGKTAGEVADAARRLAADHGRPVRALALREDVVRWGPKRPPVAIGLRSDGAGVMRVVRAPGIEDAIGAVAPGLVVEQVDVTGPRVSPAIRAAGWAEAAVALASLRAVGPDGADEIVSPDGAWASARIDPDGSVHIRVRCGRVLDAVVLRSYCIGAAHMGLGWVRSEAIAVDDEGVPLDLTIRSFGVLRATDTPSISVEVLDDNGPAVNGSDAVFAAVAAAAWRHVGFAPRWPIARAAG